MFRDACGAGKPAESHCDHSSGGALVTGASAGIGAVYADRLAKRGHDLILVARDEGQLGALSTRLAQEIERSAKVLRADFNKRPQLGAVEAGLREGPRVTMLLNNAGAASIAPPVAADIEEMEAMIALNVTALTRLTDAAVLGFLARGAGTVINIASIVGVAPEILNGVDGASKACVLAGSQSPQHELAAKGVRIQAVLPGASATELWAKAERPYQRLRPSILMSTEDMVDAALAGLDQREPVTIAGLQEGEDWIRFEAARRALSTRSANSAPAPRYRVAAAAQH